MSEALLQITDRGAVRCIALDRPPANALNPALVGALRTALADAGREAGGVVLSGTPGLFSGGLDVPELLATPRDAVTAFWGEFFALLRDLAAAPLPVVAALGGHSPAGGAVLALYCDHRIGAHGDFRIGLNEVAVGLPVSGSIIAALADLVGSRHARDLAMHGRMIRFDEALELGLVDQLVPAEELLTASCAWLDRLLALPPGAMNRTRLAGKQRLIDLLDAGDDAAQAAHHWFSGETQASMRALAARLAGKG